tara:strand:- start:748 stop:1041 length:294 start_codon:yes stop_codon:yes gene_type:complete
MSEEDGEYPKFTAPTPTAESDGPNVGVILAAVSGLLVVVGFYFGFTSLQAMGDGLVAADMDTQQGQLMLGYLLITGGIFLAALLSLGGVIRGFFSSD